MSRCPAGLAARISGTCCIYAGGSSERSSARRAKAQQTPGQLGESVDRALQPGDDIIYEIATYRGHGLVVTHNHLLLVVSGVLDGCSPTSRASTA